MSRGYFGVGIDEIGAAVGISGPAVYRHVSGKDQLVADIAATWLGTLPVALAAAANGRAAAAAGDERARLRLLVTAIVDAACRRLPEVTVTHRYVGVLPAGVDERWKTPPGVVVSESPEIERHFAEIERVWRAHVTTSLPAVTPQTSLVLIRAMGAMVIGAFASERDVSHSARVNLLADAAMRLLQMPAGNLRPAPERPLSPPWVRGNRREQILSTAVRMFRDYGYGGVSMADIAAQIGVTPSASYRHFVSKEELLATAVRRWSDRAVVSAGAALTAATDADDALCRLMDRFVHDTFADPDLACVHSRERYHVNEEHLAFVRSQDRIVVDEWVRALAVLRPEVSSAACEVLVHAAQRAVVELAGLLDSDGCDDAAEAATRTCAAILGVHMSD